MPVQLACEIFEVDTSLILLRSPPYSAPYPPFQAIGRYILCDVWGTSYSDVFWTYIIVADSGAQVIGQHPLEHVLRVLHGAHGNRLTGCGVEMKNHLRKIFIN